MFCLLAAPAHHSCTWISGRCHGGASSPRGVEMEYLFFSLLSNVTLMENTGPALRISQGDAAPGLCLSLDVPCHVGRQ